MLFLHIRKRYRKYSNEQSRLPPIYTGNANFIFGNYFDFKTKEIHLKLAEIGDNFNDLFMLRVFNKRICVLNSYEAIKETLCSKTLETAYRPNSFLIKLATNRLKDMVFALPDIRWLKNRTLFHKFFSDMKKIHNRDDFAEVVFLEEWPCFFLKLDSLEKNKESFNIKQFVYEFQSNLMTTILFGKDISQNEIFLDKIRNLDKSSKPIIADLYSTMLNLSPFEALFGSSKLSHLVYLLKCQRTLMDEIFQFKKESNRNSAETLNSTQSQNVHFSCLLNLFLSVNKIDDHIFDQINVKNVLTELLFAGIDPVANTVTSFIYNMCKYPDTQRKVFAELDGIQCDHVNLSHKKFLPVLLASIFETLRIETQIPLGIFRKTLTDISFKEYIIPKNTILIPNLWKINHDSEVYESPHEFKPDRFLNFDQEKYLDFCNERVRKLLIFGCGKRVCIGKSLAQNLIFLYVSNFLKKFEFKFDQSNTFFNTHRKLGVGLEPENFKILISRRKNSIFSSSKSQQKDSRERVHSNKSSNLKFRRSEIKTFYTRQVSLIESIQKENLLDEEDIVSSCLEN